MFILFPFLWASCQCDMEFLDVILATCFRRALVQKPSQTRLGFVSAIFLRIRFTWQHTEHPFGRPWNSRA